MISLGQALEQKPSNFISTILARVGFENFTISFTAIKIPIGASSNILSIFSFSLKSNLSCSLIRVISVIEPQIP